jgi:hypothetical protein
LEGSFREYRLAAPSTVIRSPALNGGSMIQTGPRRVDGRCTPFSGRSVESIQCRQPVIK